MLDNRVYTFIKLCETRNYTRTSELLHISQPAVSQHIKFLERELHAKLFYYDDNKHLQLTPQGSLYLNYAVSAAANAKKIQDALLNSVNAPHTVSIGAMPSIGAKILPYVISEHLKTHEMNFSILNSTNTDMLNMVRTGELDMAIVSVSPPDGFVSRILLHDSTLCICSKSHPLAGKTVDISDLYSQRLLMGYRDSDFQGNLNEILKQNNSSVSNFKHFVELGHAAAIKNHLEVSSTAISFMYGLLFQSELNRGELKQIYIRNFSSSYSLYLCYLQDAIFREEYEAFYESFKRYLENQPLQLGSFYL